MGGGLALPEGELEELIESTYFKKLDLKRWYKKFMKDFPGGKLDKEQFSELYCKMYTSNFSSQLAEHIFESFDQNNDGVISFKELMTIFSLTTKGTEREKLEWLFNVYDLDNDGKITIDEVSSMQAMLERRGPDLCSSGLACNPAADVSELPAMFELVDTDSNGSWSLEEFIEGMKAYPAFVKMLNFTPSRVRKDPA